jgi:hypothetical protein
MRTDFAYGLEEWPLGAGMSQRTRRPYLLVRVSRAVDDEREEIKETPI